MPIKLKCQACTFDCIYLIFTIIGGCFELQTLNTTENSCIKLAGYQTTVKCEPGEFPEEILSTCQENGSWIPNEMGCSGEQ